MRLAYTSNGSCPNIKITNHWSENIVIVGMNIDKVIAVNSSLVLNPIVGANNFEIQGGIVTNGKSYNIDIGFQCSTSLPELRQNYPIYSRISLKDDPASPNGLTVSALPPSGGN